jgi:hypothetical protein
MVTYISSDEPWLGRELLYLWNMAGKQAIVPSEVPLRNLGEADLGSPNFQMGSKLGTMMLYPADNTSFVPV